MHLFCEDQALFFPICDGTNFRKRSKQEKYD
jgi:hypothetical protein